MADHNDTHNNMTMSTMRIFVASMRWAHHRYVCVRVYWRRSKDHSGSIQTHNAAIASISSFRCSYTLVHVSSANYIESKLKRTIYNAQKDEENVPIVSVQKWPNLYNCRSINHIHTHSLICRAPGIRASCTNRTYEAKKKTWNILRTYQASCVISLVSSE